MKFPQICTSLAFFVAGASGAGAFGQAAPSAPQGVVSQQQSIAMQTEAVSSMSAMKQAESFRQQAESLRSQAGNSATTINGMAGSIAPIAAAATNKPALAQANDPKATGAAPASNGPEAGQTQPNQLSTNQTPSQANGKSQDGQTGARPGFYTTPWPGAPDFAMPNVQVETNACDALEAGQVDSLVNDASSRNKLDPALLRAVIVQESGFKPCAISTAGAMGLMQIMPETAGDLGLSDPFDPASNVDAGARYLKQMLDRYHGNKALALAAYNAGPGRTDKANGIPPISETIGYVSRILGNIPLY